MIVLHVFSFFFYSDCDHRYLHVLTHSFPTRRSSDLRLADFFDGHMPVAMLFGYYQCQRLCETAIDALARAVDIGNIKARLLFIGIDPRETAIDADRKRASYRRAFGDIATWHFLTGGAPAIDAIKTSFGLRTTRDADDENVHPSSEERRVGKGGVRTC